MHYGAEFSITGFRDIKTHLYYFIDTFRDKVVISTL